MSLAEAIAWLGPNYVLHPQYQPRPHHCVYALVRVDETWNRVRERMRQERSFCTEVEQVRHKLRLVHGRIA